MPTLNRIGKEAVEKHHLDIPYRLFDYNDSLSTGDKETGYLLIQDYKLYILKALLKLLTITENKKNEIYDAFDKLGPNYLKPVYDEMNETISYDELRIVQICYNSEKNND